MLLCQISDPHIVREGTLAYGKVDTPAFLERAVAHVRRQARQPDAVVVTGDLVDRATPVEYGLLWELLRPLDRPTFLLPGNHDDRTTLQRCFPDHRHMQGEDGFVQYAVEDFAVRLVVLDTVVPRMPHGELCARRLDWLERTLAASDRPTIVAQHHPPFATGLTEMDKQGLLDPSGEEAVIGRYRNVERVIAGHYHRPIQARFAGTLATVCPSTAQQLVMNLQPGAEITITYEPPGYQMHLWDGRTLVTHTAAVGDWPTWSTNE
jgi:Icc protein